MTNEAFTQKLAEFGFIVVGTDPQDPRIDVGISDKFYSIAGSRFRVTLNGDDVILADPTKLLAFIPFIAKTREVGDEDSCDVTALDANISYKRSYAAPLILDDPSTFAIGQVVEIFNLTENSIQLVGGADVFLSNRSRYSTLVLGAYRPIKLSVQKLPNDDVVFMITT